MVVKTLLSLVCAGIFAYLFGSLNSAIVVCHIAKGEDIRKFGSFNAGLTNVLRVYGKPLAGLTLLCDLFKGVVAVTLVRIFVVNLLGVTVFGNGYFVLYFSALCCMLGHIFPIYYGFKGGKGVLVAATSLLAIDPLGFVCAIAVFIIVVAISKYVSLASIISSISYGIFTLIFQYMRGIDTYLTDALVVFVMAGIIIVKHHSNISRLKNGTENRLSFKKKTKEE